MRRNLMNYTMHQLLASLVEQGASDLHLSPGSPPRLRVSGRLLALDLPKQQPKETKHLCYSVLNEEQKKNFENNKELDFAFSIEGIARFRGNVFYQRGNVCGAFRLVPNKLKSLEELGAPKSITALCDLPKGLILVTGPTGSGKTTTLASIIHQINQTRYDHVVTIEDPIEFVHSHGKSMINQREVGNDTNSFAMALRSALRQDPNVVMVGEMRDLETIQLALTAAETGHLVLGTLHTNSCVSTLNRVIDVFPSAQQGQIRSMLGLSLQAVISQVLVPANGGGRVPAMEIMIPNIAVRNLIRENKFHQIYSSMQTGQDESGMQTLNQSLFKLVNQKKISANEARAKANDLEELNNMIDSLGRVV